MSSVARLADKHKNYDLSLSFMAGPNGKQGISGLLQIFDFLEGKAVITRKVSALAYEDTLDAAEESVINKLLERAGV
jgi:hypothetical protein